jgi:hypothetical protein
MLIAGLAMAVVASLALNGGYLLQHLGSAASPAVTARRPLASVRALGRSRLWLAGTAAGLTGSLLHVGALATAPLSLVQAFSAGGLAIAVPVAARATRSRLRRMERAGVVAILVALVGLAVRPAAASGVPSGPAAWVVFAAAVVAGAAALAAVRGARRAAALAIATGLLYGLSDAATKAGTEALRHGIVAGVLSPWPPIVVAVCAAAFFALQRALQLGSPATVVTLMTAGMNVSAVAGGMTVFGEGLGTSTAVAVLHGTALAAIGVAAWWVARGQGRLGAALATV